MYKKYHTVETVPKFIHKTVEKRKFDTLSKQIHDRSLSCLVAGT